MSDSPVIDFDTDEADYFRAILSMQSAGRQNSTLPEPLMELVHAVKICVEKEGLSCSWGKPGFLSAPELAVFGAAQNATVFESGIEGAQTVIAVSQNAVAGFAAILLGGKSTPVQRAPSRVETQIVQGFIDLLGAGFKPVATPQTSIIWQDYVGAKLALNDEVDSPYIVLMMNRRSENAPIQKPQNHDIKQQKYIRHVVGNSVLNVDYMLDGGAVSLALLRDLGPGSVLPIVSLNDATLTARASDTVLFSGVLKLTPDKMSFGVRHVLTGGRDE